MKRELSEKLKRKPNTVNTSETTFATLIRGEGVAVAMTMSRETCLINLNMDDG